MKKVYTFLLVFAGVFFIAACGQEDYEIPEEVDPCEGYEDCYVMESEEVDEYLRYYAVDSVPITNKDLQKVAIIYNKYTFNYFYDDVENATDEDKDTAVSILRLFSRSYEYLKDPSSKLNRFLDIQDMIIGQEINKFVETNSIYYEDSNFKHILYKEDFNTVIYIMKDIETEEEIKYTYSLQSFSLKDGWFESYEDAKDYVNEIPNIEWADTYFKYDSEDYIQGSRELLYVNAVGGIGMQISENQLVISRTIVYEDSHASLSSSYYSVSKIEDTDTFAISYTSGDAVIAIVTYDTLFDFIKNANQDCKTELETMFYAGITEEDFNNLYD